MKRFVRRVVVLLVAALVVVACAGFALLRSAASQIASPALRPMTSNPDDVPIATLKERWRASFPVEVVGLPSVDDHGIVITAGESQVIALAVTGDVQWTTAIAGALVNAPRLDGDLVFIAAKRAVVALHRATGAVAWSVPTAGEGEEDDRVNEPVVVGEVVVATTASGRVHGLDRTTGAPKWAVDLPTASTSEPAAGGGVVVVVGIAQWHALDPSNGAIIWSGDLGLYGTSSPVVYADGDRTLAAVASNERVLAVDVHTGQGVWQSDADQSESFQVPVVTAGHELLVPDHWGRLAAFDAGSGAPIWKVRGPDAVAEFGEPAVLAPRVVAMALDAHGPRIGGPNGSRPVQTPSSGHGVAVAPSGQLIVTTWDGALNYVIAYDVEVGKSP